MSPTQYSMLLKLREHPINLTQPQPRGAIQTMRSLVARGWAAKAQIGRIKITLAGRLALAGEAGRRARKVANGH